jgi:competence protein ComEA
MADLSEDSLPPVPPSEPDAATDRTEHPTADAAPRVTHEAASFGPFPLRMRDQILLACVSAVALIAMAAYCVRTSRWGADPIEIERQPEHELDYRIELNNATWVEWSQLPEIGPVLARRIVEERERNGPFRSVDDLQRVNGMGPKRIEAARPFVRVEGVEGPADSATAGPVGCTQSP